MLVAALRHREFSSFSCIHIWEWKQVKARHKQHRIVQIFILISMNVFLSLLSFYIIRTHQYQYMLCSHEPRTNSTRCLPIQQALGMDCCVKILGCFGLWKNKKDQKECVQNRHISMIFFPFNIKEMKIIADTEKLSY